MKGKEVLLTVTGLANNVDEDDGSMKLMTTGMLTGNKNKWRLRYTEMQPDTNEKHKITMTMDKGVVTMVRDGSYGTNMVFEKGHRYESSYRTPYGSLDMGIFPTHVKYDVADDGNGEVNLKYQLDIQGQYTSFHNLRINIKASKGL
ncbi:MAG: DUF1934 domain-containing protein [Eubacteriales bacterium]|jgi:uncharacterized beta-barrel protein YwiB (DUF1934 family)|nr:DUF1934 domain-containing protein [Eubacteriales bacterium]MDD4105837.1 DUF1934 domain-containing protein [Eubacteriales bacterium]MDD4710883.1 DUF1934 domain-containing protein [Eubacteriales bacterium]NLO15664.1 DUF1934 domain-containing protein [Clostridiales bacterium]